MKRGVKKKQTNVFLPFVLKFEHSTRSVSVLPSAAVSKETVGLKKDLGSLEKKLFSLFVLTFCCMSARDEWNRFRVLPILLAGHFFFKCCT